MSVWKRYRHTLLLGYPLGIMIGAAVVVMLFTPDSFPLTASAALLGAGFGALTVTFAVFGAWAMISARSRKSNPTTQQVVVTGALGAGLAVVLGYAVIGAIAYPVTLLFVGIGVPAGLVTAFITSILMTLAEKQAGTINAAGYVIHEQHAPQPEQLT